MTNELPLNVGYGTVIGRYLLAYADSSDVDPYPDGKPASGTILFTPSADYVKNASATPDPVTILPSTVSCNLDSEGYILGPDGNRGVRLIATDDTDNNPSGWTWSVYYRLTDELGVATNTIPSHSISLPEGTTVDLTTALPVPDANGTYYIAGPTGAGYSDIVSVDTITISTGSKTFNVSKIGALEIGTRVRIADAANPTTVFMDGVITAMTSGSITVNVDYALGSGTPALWNVVVTGERGATGPTGNIGALNVDYPLIYTSGTANVKIDTVYLDSIQENIDLTIMKTFMMMGA